MKSEIYLNDVDYEDIEVLVKVIANNLQLKLTVYDGDGEYVGVFLEPKAASKGVLMFTLNKEKALFIGKALISIAKNLDPTCESD